MLLQNTLRSIPTLLAANADTIVTFDGSRQTFELPANDNFALLGTLTGITATDVYPVFRSSTPDLDIGLYIEAGETDSFGMNRTSEVQFQNDDATVTNKMADIDGFLGDYTEYIDRSAGGPYSRTRHYLKGETFTYAGAEYDVLIDFPSDPSTVPAPWETGSATTIYYKPLAVKELTNALAFHDIEYDARFNGLFSDTANVITLFNSDDPHNAISANAYDTGTDTQDKHFEFTINNAEMVADRLTIRPFTMNWHIKWNQFSENSNTTFRLYYETRETDSDSWENKTQIGSTVTKTDGWAAYETFHGEFVNNDHIVINETIRNGGGVRLYIEQANTITIRINLYFDNPNIGFIWNVRFGNKTTAQINTDGQFYVHDADLDQSYFLNRPDRGLVYVTDSHTLGPTSVGVSEQILGDYRTFHFGIQSGTDRNEMIYQSVDIPALNELARYAAADPTVGDNIVLSKSASNGYDLIYHIPSRRFFLHEELTTTSTLREQITRVATLHSLPDNNNWNSGLCWDPRYNR